MSVKLFVGNLAWQTNDDSLRAMFETAGTVVSSRVIMDKMSGKSRGFGFVEMSSAEEAQAAIAKCDGQDLDGRPIRVNEAQAESERPARPRRDFGPRTGTQNNW